MSEPKITISRESLLRNLGYQGEALRPETEALLTKAISTCEEKARPRSVSRNFAREDLLPDLSGEDIRSHLGGAETIVLLAATLGNEIDFAIRQAQLLDMTYAVILDQAASLTIEAYMDHLEAELREHYLTEKQYLTTRFSPGYGDLPLASGKRILDLLDSRRKIGLSLSPGGLMTPLKSVSCLLGLGREKPARAADPCSICKRREGCALRQKGGYCGRFTESSLENIT